MASLRSSAHCISLLIDVGRFSRRLANKDKRIVRKLYKARNMIARSRKVFAEKNYLLKSAKQSEKMAERINDRP